MFKMLKKYNEAKRQEFMLKRQRLEDEYNQLTKDEKLERRINYEKKNLEKLISKERFDELHKNKLDTLIVLLGLSVLSFIFGLFLNFTNEPDRIWFQRSGSLIVLFGALAEYVYIDFRELTKNRLIDFGDGNIMTYPIYYFKTYYPNYYKEKTNLTPIHDTSFSMIFTPMIIFCVLLGTFIWGYGDLFYSFFINMFVGYIILVLLFLVVIILLVIYKLYSKEL